MVITRPDNFSEKYAKEILDRFQKRGWNLYETKDRYSSSELIPEVAIRRGPAKKLEPDTSYILLPIVSDPKNHHLVFDALDRVARRNCMQEPTITVNLTEYKITGITLHSSSVKLHSPKGDEVRYRNFIHAIETCFDASSI